MQFSQSVICIILTVSSKCFSKSRPEYAQSLETLREHLQKDLGFSQEIDYKKVKLADEEYEKMQSVYKEMLRQTNEINAIRNQFKKLRYTTPTKHILKMSEIIEEGKPLMFDMEFYNSMKYGLTLIKSAMLDIKMRRKTPFAPSRVTLSQVVMFNETLEIDSVDVETDLDSDDVRVTFEVTDTIQSWIIDQDRQKGFILTADGFELVMENSPIVRVESLFSLTRQKRSLIPGYQVQMESETGHDCDATSIKCCRDNMLVDLRELDGFNFILEPKQFNAYMCRGRCPARYRPMNDHSLLQSLMHIKQQNEMKDAAVSDDGNNFIKRPCCVPSKLSSLPILHLDEKNPSKLKVTSWKSIIVTECSCG